MTETTQPLSTGGCEMCACQMTQQDIEPGIRCSGCKHPRRHHSET